MPSIQATLLYPAMTLCILCIATPCITTLILLLPPPWWWLSWFVIRPQTKQFFRRRKAQAPATLVAPVTPVTPPRNSQRKPDWVRAEVLRLFHAMPGSGCRSLSNVFNRLHAAIDGMTVGKTWVSNLLREHHRARDAYSSAIKHRVPDPMACNAVWGMDLTFKQDEAGDLHPILGIIDHGSRKALVLLPLQNKATITLLRALLNAMETYGKPQRLFTDNESMFRSRLFRFCLAVLGIRQRFSKLHCPWQNGHIERLFGTLKKKLNRITVANFAALSHAMLEFKTFYNHVRPHQHLQGRTPQETWDGIDPRRCAPKQARFVKAWGGLLTGYHVRR